MNPDEVQQVLSKLDTQKRRLQDTDDEDDQEHPVTSKKQKKSRGRKCCLCGKVNYSRMDQHLKSVHKENRAADRQRFARLLLDVSTFKFFLNIKSCEIRVCHPYVLFMLLASLRSKARVSGHGGIRIFCLSTHAQMYLYFCMYRLAVF